MRPVASWSRRVVARWLGWTLVLFGAAAGLRLIVWFIVGGPNTSRPHNLLPEMLWEAGTVPETFAALLLLVAGSGFLLCGLRGEGSGATRARIFGFLVLLVGIGLALLVPDSTLAVIPTFGP